ncbi:MAG: type II toxin-antitoxin system VapC family toxin [Gammaproteobacteria bacterium]|nr:type II toxin-antitoxin system VapC family toxin [Gammaproteobacteria bacterium]
MSRIFWDTNLFVYLLEDKGELTERVVALRERMVERNDELLTSTLTLSEILVRPVEVGDETLARRYEQSITAAATVLSFDRAAAAAFAGIRRDRSIAPPDAIQLACASVAGVDMFITNDLRLSRQVVPGIHFIQSFANAAL